MILWKSHHEDTWPNLNMHRGKWPSENSSTGIHDQVWISTVGNMNTCEYKDRMCKYVWLSTLRYITTWEYQNEIKWPSDTSNTATHDQVWMVTMGLYPSENGNMEIYDKVLLSMWRYMTKWEYQHWGHMTKYGYQ